MTIIQDWSDQEQYKTRQDKNKTGLVRMLKKRTDICARCLKRLTLIFNAWRVIDRL